MTWMGWGEGAWQVFETVKEGGGIPYPVMTTRQIVMESLVSLSGVEDEGVQEHEEVREEVN